MPLTMDLKPGQKLQVGEATITLEQKSGQLARLVIDAPKTVEVRKLGTSPSMQIIAERGFSPSPA